MKIKEITNQTRRDFTAIYQCEHCALEVNGRGYDDAYFHNNVIPKMTCAGCGKTSKDNYRPLSPKYPEGFVI